MTTFPPLDDTHASILITGLRSTEIVRVLDEIHRIDVSEQVMVFPLRGRLAPVLLTVPFPPHSTPNLELAIRALEDVYDTELTLTPYGNDNMYTQLRRTP